MLPKSLMKNPVLVIGILFMAIFLFTNKDKLFKARKESLMPTSCRALRVKLDRRIPANWKSQCEGNNLAVEVQFLADSKEVEKKMSKDPKYKKQVLYRELANALVLTAKNSPSDNLERTNFIRLKLMAPGITINALTEGRYLVKFATLKDRNFIAEHLKATVKVQEVPSK